MGVRVRVRVSVRMRVSVRVSVRARVSFRVSVWVRVSEGPRRPPWLGRGLVLGLVAWVRVSEGGFTHLGVGRRGLAAHRQQFVCQRRRQLPHVHLQRIYTHIHIYIQIHIYTCIYTCIYTYMYMYMYMARGKEGWRAWMSDNGAVERISRRVNHTAPQRAGGGMRPGWCFAGTGGTTRGRR